MIEHCIGCGKDIDVFSIVNLDNQSYCMECSKNVSADKNIYTPDDDAIRRALSVLLTQDPDTKKLFESDSRTCLKISERDIDNFINLNSNLIQSCLLLKILEKMEKMEIAIGRIEARFMHI